MSDAPGFLPDTTRNSAVEAESEYLDLSVPDPPTAEDWAPLFAVLGPSGLAFEFMYMCRTGESRTNPSDRTRMVHCYKNSLSRRSVSLNEAGVCFGQNGEVVDLAERLNEALGLSPPLPQGLSNAHIRQALAERDVHAEREAAHAAWQAEQDRIATAQRIANRQRAEERANEVLERWVKEEAVNPTPTILSRFDKTLPFEG